MVEMLNWPLLSLVTFLPLVGVLFLLTLKASPAAESNARFIALFTSLATFLLSLALVAHFDSAQSDFQFVETLSWMPSLNIQYRMGVDGISLWFVLLSTFLVPICILASWSSIKTRVREYMIAFLVLEIFMVGMFCALDLFLFYVFFEAVLIPMFMIIGIWGGHRRIYASFKLFLYTLLGSVLMLVAILALYHTTGTSDIATLLKTPIDKNLQNWLWLAFFASFAVKVPMWPVHTWLPDAHVEAPTAGSVILAGVLLKMGGYGFIRFSIPIFPDASAYFMPAVFALSVIAIIYTSLVALVQTDMKKLIAYSSIAHMGFVTMGLFTLTQQGIEGAIFQMLSHGVVSGALFLCVGVLYDRLHKRDIAAYGGIVTNMPVFAVLMMVFTLASIGVPGTSGFVGEFLSLLGAFSVNTWVTVMAATGLVLGAAYMLSLYKRVVFGEVTNPEAGRMKDLSVREIVIFAPLVLLVVVMGIYPRFVLQPIAPSVAKIVSGLETAGVIEKPILHQLADLPAENPQ
jgi:NADH-quinone oxidoreductase subunit M